MQGATRLCLDKTGQTAESSVRAKSAQLIKTVKSPVPSAGKRLSSATIYGQHLYIAEMPLTSNQLKLHVTAFIPLMELEDGATLVWTSKIVGINKLVLGNFNDVKIKLSSKQMENTLKTPKLNIWFSWRMGSRKKAPESHMKKYLKILGLIRCRKFVVTIWVRCF